MSEPRENASVVAGGTAEAVAYLRRVLCQGRPWHQALLEAIALWTAPQEVCQGRHFNYLLDGEALDWLLLAERLLMEVDGLIPRDEGERLLFRGQLPRPLSARRFRDLIGPEKYRAYLNYWYGVVVEEALLEAVEGEVYKARRGNGLPDTGQVTEEAFTLIYGASRTQLLRCFRNERGYPQAPSISLTESKEFTYWLFKCRMRTQDRARVASDTRKGLEHLQQAWGALPWVEE